MMQIGLYLAMAAAIVAATFWGTNRLIDSGREFERARIERQEAEGELLAHEMRLRAQQALDNLNRQRQAENDAMRAELEGMRDERAADNDADGIVFDERWNAWLRGKTADRPGS